MDESILVLLKKAGKFSEKDSLLLKKELQFRELKKGDVLLEKGTICSSLCFIVSGSFYQYNIDSELNKNIIDLNTENDWVINQKSFTSRKPSEYSIQAYCILELFDTFGCGDSFSAYSIIDQAYTLTYHKVGY